ncbi:MAG: host-nuclease inhibitor Gam family protein [Opitutaceae bacterium]
MSPRIKASSFAHRAEFDKALDNIAMLQVKLRILEGKRDKAIQAIRDEHGPRIDEVAGELKRLVVLAEKYAETHRAEILPTGKKSAETALACFGFRIGNPRLVLLNRKWSWESVLQACKSAFGERFVRRTESVDKDALKTQLADDELAQVGCRIEQTEAFFIEAKDQPREEVA